MKFRPGFWDNRGVKPGKQLSLTPAQTFWRAVIVLYEWFSGRSDADQSGLPRERATRGEKSLPFARVAEHLSCASRERVRRQMREWHPSAWNTKACGCRDSTDRTSSLLFCDFNHHVLFSRWSKVCGLGGAGWCELWVALQWHRAPHWWFLAAQIAGAN